MKNIFYCIILFSLLSCQEKTPIEAKIMIDEKYEKMTVVYTNTSDTNFYFLTPFLIGQVEKEYLFAQNEKVNKSTSIDNEDSVRVIINDLGVNKNLDLIQEHSVPFFKNKSIAFNNYTQSLESFGFLPYFENTKPNEKEIDLLTTFIEKKSSLKITYKIENIKKKTKYVCFLQNWIRPDINKDKVRAYQKFYSYGKIADYSPYIRSIDCKPITIEL